MPLLADSSCHRIHHSEIRYCLYYHASTQSEMYSALLKVRQLEISLQQLDGFGEERSVALEQYETPPHIAAHTLHNAQSRHADVEGAWVLDACCGPGMLGAGAALLGASLVTCVDVDTEALRVLRRNAEQLPATLEPLLADLTALPLSWDNAFDVVFMNPPFGTKHNAGLDMKLLQTALRLTSGAVYSFHKSSTRAGIKRRVREWGASGEVLAELRFPLPATFRFHRSAARDVAVDLWRVHHKQ